MDSEIFNLSPANVGGGTWPSPGPMAVALRLGLEHPYLLHQLLAFSAWHLGSLHPHKSASYAHQAVTLQTRAISLFNVACTSTEVNAANCVAVLLFSSVLGHHLLAETLARREHDGLTSFIDLFVQSLDIHRGVRTVAHSSWPLLKKSELEPMLSSSSKFTSQSPTGDHCHRIKELIETSNSLVESEREACRVAIRYLQIGFDAVEADQDYNQMIFLWGMLSPPEYTELLKDRRFEALVILGYYSLLLHHGRNMWQVRDAGSYIMGMLVDYLGPTSQECIAYPRDMIEKGNES